MKAGSRLTPAVRADWTLTASEAVQADEFKEFVQGLGLADHYPHSGIGFSIRLKPEERVALVEARKREELETFHIWPDLKK